MRKSGLKNAAVFAAAFILAFVCSGSALALDATSFDPRNVAVEANAISGVPVGTIITWPVATNPEGWDEGKWLECNGQTISQAVYPVLFALTGGTVPDLRGLFLRGVGGNAAALGSVQEDAGRNIVGQTGWRDDTGVMGAVTDTSGAFYGIGWGPKRMTSTHGQVAATYLGLDASRVWGATHTTDAATGEFRPVNRAVRYLIRAQP